ncbi:12911_t:CDS:2, partial [Funneliformis geosporum]
EFIQSDLEYPVPDLISACQTSNSNICWIENHPQNILFENNTAYVMENFHLDIVTKAHTLGLSSISH